MKHIFLSIKKWLKDTRHLEEGTTERSSTDVTSGRNKNAIARFLHALRLVGMTPFVILSRKAKNPVTLAVSILGFFIAILAIIYIGNRMGIFFQAAGADPVAYWKFDEGQGSTLNDSTGSYNAALGGGSSSPTWTTADQCVNGKCLYFDGTNDYTMSTNITTLNSTTPFTVEIWFKPISAGVIVSEVGQQVINSGWHDSWIEVLSTGELKIRVWSCTAVSLGTVQFNKWNHAVMTYTTGTLGGYLNTNADTSGSCSRSHPAGSGYNEFLSLGPADSTNLGSGAFFKGYVDEFKVYNYVRSADQIKADYAARGTTKGVAAQFGDDDLSRKLSSGLVGYWKMDEATGSTGPSWTALDSSGNGNNGVGVSDAGPGVGKFGNGGSFDGSGDGVLISNFSQMVINESDFAYSVWFKADYTGTYMQLTGSFTGDWPKSSLSYDGASTRINYYSAVAGGPDYQLYSAVGSALAGQWNHVVITGKWNERLVYGYVNGSPFGTTTFPSGALNTSNHTIGYSSQYGRYFDGVIDEVRMYNRALDPSEVKALYQWAPGPIGHWTMDDGVSGDSQTIKDISGNGNNGTTSDGANNTGMNCTVAGKFGKGCSFDGSDDYVNSSYDSNFSTNSFSISGWVKSSSSSEQELISTVAEKGANDPFISLRLTATGTAIFEVRGDDGQSTISAPSTSTYNNGQWHYVTGIKNATSNIKLYVDGVLVATSGSGISGSVNISSYPLYIGARNERGGAPSQYFNGQIDDVRIYNYARTPEQIVSDMNAGHPAVGTPVGSTVLHLKMDEGYGSTTYDWSPQQNNGTLGAGSSAPTWTNDGKFGKALSFDGGDYIEVADNSSLDSFEISLSFWFRLTNNFSSSSTNDLGVLAKYDTDTPSSGDYLVRLESDDGKLLFGVHNGTSWEELKSATSSWSSTIWYHVIITSSQTDGSKIYINGVPNSTDLAVYNTLSNNKKLCIGSKSDSSGLCYVTGPVGFDGLIDEVKIYPFALTADQVKTEYAGGKTQVLGSRSTGVGGTAPDNSSSRSYCVPGDASACSAPVGEWNFNEGVGSTANDTSTSGNTGTLAVGSSAPMWVPGKFGSALNFDGNDYLDVGVTNLPTGAGARTISAWIKQNSTATRYYVAGYGANSANQEFRLVLNAFIPGEFGIDVWGSAWISTASLQANRWYYLAVTYAGSGTPTFYVDGVAYSATTVGSPSVNTSASGGKIGIRGDGTYPFKGLIDQVRIYNYARTPAQIAWEYNRGAPVAYYKFNECSGTVVNDWGPNAKGGTNGNNGTLELGSNGVTSAGTCTTSGAWANGATGKRDASISFDGSDDYVNILDNTLLNITGEITLAAWIKTTTNNISVISKRNNTSPWNGYVLAIGANGNNGKISYWPGNYASYSWQYGDSTNVTDGSWHHIAVTHSGTTATFYIDGKPDGTRTVGSRTNNSANDLRISQETEGVRTFNGLIDDVKIFNYAFTPQQVRTEMNSGAVRFE